MRQIQKLKLCQTQIVTKLKNLNCDKTLKINFDKTQKLKLQKKTQNVTKLKKTNCDKI